ncbi:hypothetical protein M885DRAFT_265900 [Pelagophyceae sp. CCMP2097]|nr:hypothetical protein M885DRAFT_265900 [Pelagophyceae sp. CCMP2097]
MALRCLFVAYCSPTSSTVPLVALLRFARDFRLLTAARFSPAAVVDCARAARHANYVSGEATSLRWPEFVETLVLLSSERSEARADSLADALKALLVLMDPGGRVFVEPRTCTDAPATDDPLDRRRGKASPNRRNEYFVDDNRIGERQASSGPRRRRDGDSLSPNKGDRRDGDRRDGDRRDDRREGDRRDRRADDRRESDRRESERLSEERAMKDRDGGDEAPHTRRRAGGDAPAPQPPEDDWMFAAQRLARAEETRRCLAEAAESTRRAATKSDSADLRQIADGVSRAAEGMLLKLRAPVRAVAAPPPAEPAPSPLPGEEWPPPPRRSPDEIWDKPDAPAPQPIHPDELRRRRAEMQAEAEASLDAADDEDPWWWVSRTFDGTTAARHVAATFLQRLARGAMLRIRLALLRARLLRGGVSAPRRSNGSAASPGPVPPIVVAPATSDERAVIHAFALAALIGDGSPRRIARAKVLVETLRQLPEVPGGGAAQLQGALRPMLPRRPPSLEELEDDLRDALARASIEENRGADSSQARLTADACAAAVRAHPGFEARAASDHALFEQDERQANVNALAHMRSLVPKDVAATDKAGVTADLALALGVPAEAPRLRALATRIWAERSLWLVHADAASTAKAHVADLRSRYGYHKLDVVELRAVYAALPMEFENDADGAKMEWREELRQRLVEAVGDERGVPRRHAAYAILSGDRQVDRMPVDRMPLPSPVAGDDDDDDDKRTAIDTGLSIRTEASGTEWRECFDDHYERVYFFNTRTGDSRWTAPDEFRPLSRPPNEAPPGSVPPDLNRLLAQQPALAAAAAHAGRV